MTEKTLLENRDYWTQRAGGYSEVNQLELRTESRTRWQNMLKRKIDEHFPDSKTNELHVLDIGTGPGFFAILLTEAGLNVTAIDLTPSMLDEAKQNAGSLAEQISFMEMNAEELQFPDAHFDLIVTRNLTWNLPHPENACREWCRVLKKGGMMLNFDANWYTYLKDDAAREAYERDREASARLNVDDQNVGENFDVMEEIAGRLPLSGTLRPEWDRTVLESAGMNVTTDTEIWKDLWSAEEQINFASTPMFLVQAENPL